MNEEVRMKSHIINLETNVDVEKTVANKPRKRKVHDLNETLSENEKQGFSELNLNNNNRDPAFVTISEYIENIRYYKEKSKKVYAQFLKVDLDALSIFLDKWNISCHYLVKLKKHIDVIKQTKLDDKSLWDHFLNEKSIAELFKILPLKYEKVKKHARLSTETGKKNPSELTIGRYIEYAVKEINNSEYANVLEVNQKDLMSHFKLCKVNKYYFESLKFKIKNDANLIKLMNENLTLKNANTLVSLWPKNLFSKKKKHKKDMVLNVPTNVTQCDDDNKMPEPGSEWMLFFSHSNEQYNSMENVNLNITDVFLDEDYFNNTEKEEADRVTNDIYEKKHEMEIEMKPENEDNFDISYFLNYPSPK